MRGVRRLEGSRMRLLFRRLWGYLEDQPEGTAGEEGTKKDKRTLSWCILRFRVSYRH